MDDERDSLSLGLVAEFGQGVVAEVHADRIRRSQIQRVGPAAANRRHRDCDWRLEPPGRTKELANRVVGHEREVA